MRSLWLTNDLPPRAGGIEQFVGNLLRRLEPEHTVVVGPAHPEADRFDSLQPYQVVRAPGQVWPTPRVLRLVRAVARDHRPDVVVLGASWPLGELAPALGRDPAVPLVALTHGLEAGLAGAGLGLLIRRATRGLTAATIVSGFTEQRLRPHLRAARVERLAPGVDPGTFHPALDGAPLRAGWGIPLGAPLVGCISRLVRRKGQDVLVAAWPQVHRRHPDAWLVLVGTGPREAALRQAVARLGPGGQVVVAGPVAWSHLPAAYAALDLFAMPCRTRLLGTDVEGLGVCYLEAQACAVPAIVGRSGGAPEAVRDGETGLVIDGDDVDAVGGAISDLLADRQRRLQMGEAGRRWIEQVWAWDRIAARFHRLLQEVAAGGRLAP